MTQRQDDSHLDGIIDATMEIAAERKAVKREMKQALQAHRWRDALLCACKLTGIEPTEAIRNFPDLEGAGRDSAPKDISSHVM